MNSNGIKRCLIIFIVCLFVLASVKAWAEDIYPSLPPLFTDQELDDILAPIALYPDPLLAQILPASTYTEEIADAYDWLNSGGAISEIDWQNWDDSVKAVARYPEVLKMMAESGDWTADLGDAFLDQPEDVTTSIQRLRWQARQAGNLASNKWQNIVIVGDYIEIFPAQPQYVYVPSYDPAVVYVERWRPGIDPFFSFGIGLMIGSWLTMDFDWHNHHVIYHGWNRPGWVNQSKPYVHNRNVYVGKNKPFINKSWKHDAKRGNPDSYRTARPADRSGDAVKSRVPEIKEKPAIAAPPKPYPKAGPAIDTRFSGKRDRENSGSDLSPQSNTSPDIKKRPSITGQSTGQKPASVTPDMNQKPQFSGQGTGGNVQPGSAGEVRKRIPKPAATAEGYKGPRKAGRQSKEKTRPSVEVKEKSASVEKNHSETPAGNSGASERNSDSKGGSPAGRGDNGGRWGR